VPKLVSHLHLPVQSGSDRVLAAMKRGYTALEYKSLVRKLRAARPDLSLSSDFIVGFPGETAEDFEKTMKLIDEVGFDASFSFLYSARPGTPAAELADDTPQRSSSNACCACRSASTNWRRPFPLAMVGSVQRVLVEGCRRRTAANWPGAPTTTASSISPAMLPTQHGARSLPRCAHHLRDAALAARRNREPTGMTDPHDCKHRYSKSRAPNCCCRRSTTNSSPTCAAPSTRICARSRPHSTSRSPAAASALRCAARPRRPRAPPRRCSSSTRRPRTRCRSTKSSSA
jgi:hypothetical protein